MQGTSRHERKNLKFLGKRVETFESSLHHRRPFSLGLRIKLIFRTFCNPLWKRTPGNAFPPLIRIRFICFFLVSFLCSNAYRTTARSAHHPAICDLNSIEFSFLHARNYNNCFGSSFRCFSAFALLLETIGITRDNVGMCGGIRETATRPHL